MQIISLFAFRTHRIHPRSAPDWQRSGTVPSPSWRQWPRSGHSPGSEVPPESPPGRPCHSWPAAHDRCTAPEGNPCCR